MKNHKTKRGVTLVEIAIVLVIIGLLLGGVLKGQELINNAKIRSIADRQNSLKVAWFSFIDRYQALPGDYVRALQSIPGAADATGHPPGAAGIAGDGIIEVGESAIVFQNLTGAGYLRCPQCTENGSGAAGAITAATPLPSASNSLQNQYGGVMSIWHDGDNYSTTGGPGGSKRLQIHTGALLPSNIISEVDRKLDDGIANTGDVVFNIYDPSATGLGGGTECQYDPVAGAVLVNNAAAGLITTNPVDWRWASLAPPVANNCGASVTI